MWYFWRVCLWTGFATVGFGLAVMGYAELLHAQIREDERRHETEEIALRDAGAPQDHRERVATAHEEALRPERERYIAVMVTGSLMLMAGLVVGVLGILAPGARRPKRPKEGLVGGADEGW
jgi:hypothetical protein